jgi:hypothetical protein
MRRKKGLMPPQEQLGYLEEEIGILQLRIQAYQENIDHLHKQIQSAWADRDWWRRQAQKWMPRPKRLKKEQLFTVDEWNVLPEKFKAWIAKRYLRIRVTHRRKV